VKTGTARRKPELSARRFVKRDTGDWLLRNIPVQSLVTLIQPHLLGFLVKAEGSSDKHGQGHGRGKHDYHHGPVLLALTTGGARFGFIEDEEDCLIDPEALLASPFICGS
jgi:hypothetical protein